METGLILRYMIELTLLIPSAVFALLPVKNYYRTTRRKVAGATVILVLCFLIIGGILGAKSGLSSRSLFIAGIVIFLLPYYLVLDMPPVKKLFCYFNAVIFSTFCVLYSSILGAPFELGNVFPVFTFQTGWLCLGLGVLIMVGFYKTLTVKLPFLLDGDGLNRTWIFLLLMPVLLSILFLWVIPKSAEVVMTGRVRSTALLFLILVPSSMWFLYHTLWQFGERLTESAKLREERELMEMETKRYEELRAYMNETRTLRHDFRQHLLVINEYASKGETDKLNEYISHFSEVLSPSGITFCANGAVDAIASHYDSLAASQEVDVEWTLSLPTELPLPEADICGIIGNLVENALHAVADVPESQRMITVKVQMLSDAMLGIDVRNPFTGTIRFDRNGLPRSTRNKGIKRAVRAATGAGSSSLYDNHGIGLTSVSATVHKYGGTMDISADDGFFNVAILLFTGD